MEMTILAITFSVIRTNEDASLGKDLFVPNRRPCSHGFSLGREQVWQHSWQCAYRSFGSDYLLLTELAAGLDPLICLPCSELLKTFFFFFKVEELFKTVGHLGGIQDSTRVP